MNDPFSAKRGMVQMLLKMLKKHAADEVGSGLKKPEGEGDMHGLQAEKVEDLPDHEMDRATPEHEVDTKLVDEGRHTANAGYNKGGLVMDKVNAADPTPKIHSGPAPMEREDGHPDGEGSAHEEATESEQKRESEGDMEPMHSPFESFLKKRKKSNSL